MNIVTVLHAKAMEFADEALLAKMEGNFEASTSLFEKAFALEREAAASIVEEKQHSVSKHILIRSAAALAISCGKYQEAALLIQEGLNADPPAFIHQELSTLKELVAEQLNSGKTDYVEIIGIITHADSDESLIRLQDIKTKEVYQIVVPSHLINEIVKSYWADVVQVKAQRNTSGIIVLDKISSAA
jgi:hypothetical protein